MFERGLYSGDYNSMPDYMKQMMQNYYGGIKPFWQLAGLMDFITWILIMTLIVVAIRYLWLLGNKVK